MAMALGQQLPLVPGITPQARLHLVQHSKNGVNIQQVPAVFPENTPRANTSISYKTPLSGERKIPVSFTAHPPKGGSD